MCSLNQQQIAVADSPISYSSSPFDYCICIRLYFPSLSVAYVAVKQDLSQQLDCNIELLCMQLFEVEIVSSASVAPACRCPQTLFVCPFSPAHVLNSVSHLPGTHFCRTFREFLEDFSEIFPFSLSFPYSATWWPMRKLFVRNVCISFSYNSFRKSHYLFLIFFIILTFAVAHAIR